MRRTGSTSQILQSPLMMEQSDLPVSSNSSMMEGLQDSTLEPRGRRKHKSLSYMPLLITPLTNPWSHYLPGSTTASGVITQHMPSLRTLSMISMTGDSLLMCTNTTSTIRSAPTSPRRWSFWRQTIRAPSRTVPSLRNTSLPPSSQTGSNTLPFAHIQEAFSQCGRGGAQSSHPEFPPTRDEDVSM